MSYADFKPIVDLVLDNWTALQLAVEHGMGTPGGAKGLQSMSEDLTRYCVQNVVESDDLAEMLEDLLDEEFETVCEDGSPKEIAWLLSEYIGLLRAGKQEELMSRVAKLPKCQKWLSRPIHTPGTAPGVSDSDDDSTGSSDDEELEAPRDVTAAPPARDVTAPAPTPMDEDEAEEEEEPGWTRVHHRRRK